MGRITIFSTDDCPHCHHAKAAMTERGVPFTNISLTAYPFKRNDMLALSDRLTVPQVFLNELHIGGSVETIAMLEKWDADRGRTPKETYDILVADGGDPKDPRLSLPTSPPVKPKPPPPRDLYHSITLPDGSMASVLMITELLKKIIDRRDLTYHLKTYKRCFRGSDFIAALMSHYSIDATAALQFAWTLQNDHKILDHVVGDHDIQNTDTLFFRLQCDQRPKVLNSYRIWTERVDKDFISLANRLKKLLGQVERAMTDKNGKVDYKNAHTHAMYPVFEEAVCELQSVNLAASTYEVKLAFYINVYNLMIKYAFMKVGIGATDLTRASFFNNVKMQIGFDILSFQDLENGILRGNRKAPFALYHPFQEDDSRLRLVLPKVDNRIHFALNCGATSCPPVKAFSGESVIEELRIVSQAFCEDDSNVKIDTENATVHLSTIFYWYRDDFCGSNNELPKAILPFLRGGKQQSMNLALNSGVKLKVQFNPYDWSTNASDFVPFNGGNLKTKGSWFLRSP